MGRSWWTVGVFGDTFNIYFKILHDIYKNKSRLLRMGLSPDDLCTVCRVPEPNFHAFVGCMVVSGAWSLFRFIINTISNDDLSSFPDEDFLFLNFSKNRFEKEIIFVLSNYVNFIDMSRKMKEEISANSFAGFLKSNFIHIDSTKLLNLKSILFPQWS